MGRSLPTKNFGASRRPILLPATIRRVSETGQLSTLLHGYANLLKKLNTSESVNLHKCLILPRIHRMKWRSASSAGQFGMLNQTLTLDQVTEFRRTRRVKEGTGSSASVSAAFGPVGPIHPENPGLTVVSRDGHSCLPPIP